MGEDNGFGEAVKIEAQEFFNAFGEERGAGFILYPLFALAFAETGIRDFAGAADRPKPTLTNSEVKRDLTHLLTGRNHPFGIHAVARGAAIQAPDHSVDERGLAAAHRAGNGEEAKLRKVHCVNLIACYPKGHEILEAEFLWTHMGIRGWGLGNT